MPEAKNIRTEETLVEGSSDLPLSELVQLRSSRDMEEVESPPRKEMVDPPADRQKGTPSEIDRVGSETTADAAIKPETLTPTPSDGTSAIPSRIGVPMREQSAPGAYALAPPGSSVRPERENIIRPDPEAGINIRSSGNDVPVANPVEDDALTVPIATEENDQYLSQRRRQRDKTLQTSSILAIFVLLVVVGIVVGILVSRHDNAGRTTPPTWTPSSMPSIAPTLSPFETMVLLLPDYTIAALEDPTSPQSKALHWLELDFEFQEGSYPSDRFVQRFALATLYFATGGDEWGKSTSWLNHSINECHWFCKDKYLDLDWDSFTYISVNYSNPCEIPAEHLEEPMPFRSETNHNFMHLWLHTNGLQGTIPMELFLLSDLRSLSLYGNGELKGPLPSHIGQLTKLEALHLSSMPLGGTLPTEIGRLESLFSIAIYSAELGGSVPTEMGQLGRLHDILMDGNELTGNLPEQLSTMSSLNWLYLDENSLTGPLPLALTKLPLEEFSVYHNQLTGTIPTELGALPDVWRVHLFTNLLTGTIPTELGLMASIRTLDLDDNLLVGEIPGALGSLTSMRYFYACCNDLTGPIPMQLGQSLALEWLVIGRNKLTGPIPGDVLELPALEGVNLFFNCLSGSLPSELGPSFGVFSGQGNPLTGTIPESYNSLRWFNITDTLISGDVPDLLCTNATVDFDCSSFLCGCHCGCNRSLG